MASYNFFSVYVLESNPEYKIFNNLSACDCAAPGKRQPDRQLKTDTHVCKMVFNFEKPPFKGRLYLSVWCTNLGLGKKCLIQANCTTRNRMC